MRFSAALLLLLAQDADVQKLIDQLAADSIDQRESAFRKLEAIGRPALPLLEKAAADPDGEVASRVRTLLVRIPIRERLTAALVDHVKGIYERLAHGEWKEVFLEVAADQRLPQEQRSFPGVREEDLSFIAPRAVELARTEPEKIAVCQAVGRCRLKSAMPQVALLLRDSQVMVRANAAAAIRDAGARENAADLRGLVTDVHPQVRSVAAHALGRLGVKEAAPDLIPLLRDPSSDVRWWVLGALADLGAVEAADEVARLKADPDERVQQAAAKVEASLRRKP